VHTLNSSSLRGNHEIPIDSPLNPRYYARNPMPDAPAKPYDVFLSHSHADAEPVEQLAQLLHSKAVKVWLDKWVLVPGQPWRQAMAKGIDQAASCAVCIGTKTPRGWFEEEIGRALNRQTQEPAFGVIPVILPGGDPSLVDGFLELRTWVIFKNAISDPNALYRLTCGIKGIAPGPGPDTALPKASSIFTVPLPKNPFFTERANELADLKASLEKTGSFALTGLGGVGKTQTAAEYAHRQRDKYQAVFWLRAETRETLFTDLTTLARLLKLPEADAQEQKLAVDAAQRWLDEDDNWLLILDNVNDLKTVDVLTRKARPQRHHVVVTQQAQATGAIASKKHLPSMSDETGALLLLRRAQRIAADADLSAANSADVASAKKISHEVGGLPLAIDQAGAYINQTGCGVSEYLDLLHDSMADLLDRRGDLDFEHRSVTATYTASLAELAKLNEAAAELMKGVAFLAPDAIPEEIFTEGATEFPEALQKEAANRLKWNDAIAAAFKFSLLERDAGNKTISVHRMVQAVAKAGMTLEDRAQWAERVVKAVSAAFPDPEFANWGACDRLLAHAQVCAALIEEYNLSSHAAGRLLNQAGYYLKDRARYAEAEQLYRRSLTIAEKAFGADSGEFALSLNNLAQLLQTTNRLADAEPLMRRALAIDEKSLGPDHPNVAIRLNNLAMLLHATNRLADAEPLMRRALAIDEKSLGPDHPNVAIRLNNLTPLLKATGRLADAEPLMRRAFQITEKSYGPDHPTVAIRLNNLGRLLYATNRLADAEPLMRRALQIDEGAYGPDHPDVARDLNNLALLLQATNRLAEAEPLMRRHLEIFLKFTRGTGHEHPHLRAAFGNYAILLQQMGYSDDQIRANLHDLAAKYGVSLDE
jgi:tetratricopeptide (TPR) repeat protein